MTRLDWNWLEESIYGKYKSFMNIIKLFLENKCHENPRACVCIHMYAHACSRPAYACFMLTYAYLDMHTHVMVPETIKDKFSTFSQYKSHMWYLFKTQKFLRENTRFSLELVDQRGSFSKTSSSQYFSNLSLFWPWSLSFKITNHFCIWLWIDLTEGNDQNQAWKALLLRY